MAIRPAAKKTYFAEYDGANSTEILALSNLTGHGCTITSEVGGVLTINDPLVGINYVINTGEFCYKDPQDVPTNMEITSSAIFDNLFFKTDVSVGIATVPSLLLTQNVTVTVTLKTPLFDTNYTAIALITGGIALLGALQVNSVTVVDEDTVDVVVQNTGLVTLSGASLLIVATRN